MTTSDDGGGARRGLAALLRLDPESWAAVSGMLAMLALPQVGTRLTNIEVELDGEWQVIHAVHVSEAEVVFVHGVNGHSRQWTVPLASGMPRWKPSFGGRGARSRDSDGGPTS